MSLPTALTLVVIAVLILGVAIYAFTNPHNITLRNKNKNSKKSETTAKN